MHVDNFLNCSFVVPSAIDPDSREFGIQNYILEPETEMFKLEITTKMDGSTDVKVVLQSQLDRENQEAYQVDNLNTAFVEILCTKSVVRC